MISILLYDTKQKEKEQLTAKFRDAVAYHSDERCNVYAFESAKLLYTVMKENKEMDIGCLDVAAKDGVKDAEHVRENYPEMEIMLIADQSMSPLDYIRPGIRAVSLLLRPFKEKETERIIGEFLGAYISSLDDSGDAAMVLRSREGVVKLPFYKICFVEARMKKIYIRTDTEEYGYYDTLDRLMEELTADFVRCHRGYIVNRVRVRKMDVVENMIFLDNGMQIPLSRRYKAELKGVI